MQLPTQGGAATPLTLGCVVKPLRGTGLASTARLTPNLGLLKSALLIGVAMLASGCQESRKAGGDTQSDADRDHKSQGTHSHRPKPKNAPHGGRIVSIGHRHHKSGGETYYYAEVMPVLKGRISFYLLVQTPDGKLQSESFDGSIEAYVNKPGGGSFDSRSIRFEPSGSDDGHSSFSADIPTLFTKTGRLLIVVPKIRLGGERFAFSFRVDVEQTKGSSKSEKQKETKKKSEKSQ